MSHFWYHNLCYLLLIVVAYSFDDTCTFQGNSPTVWIDDAPDCEADASYCKQFGLEYVCQESFQNETCSNGTRVLCSYPAPSKPLRDTSATMLKVIAYNIWELRYLYWQSGQRERTCRIVPEILRLHADVDVIVFNEAFMGGCFASGEAPLTLRDILEYYGFSEYTRTVGFIPTRTKPENGGVFIASKWPITKERRHVYEHSERTTADSLSQKGTVYAEIEKTVGNETRKYHIFGTHLQAFERRNSSLVRVLQAQEMYDFKEAQNIGPGEAVIYAGDLNADQINRPEHAEEVIGTLQAVVPEIVGEYQSSYNTGINDIFLDVPSDGSWLDYALYSAEHLLPSRSTLQVVRPRSRKPFRACLNALPPRHVYPESSSCLRSKEITDLADHFAVMGTFDFGDGLWTTTQPPACSVPPDVPAVWLDDAPNCIADEDHCARFGLDFVCSEPFVDPDPPFNNSCTNGTRALCTFPPIPSPLEVTAATHFKVLAYNVWELRYFYYETGQRERTCRIIPEVFRLHPDLDAIIFNEVWMGGCIAGYNVSINGDLMQYREILTSYGFKYYTATIGNPPSRRTFENGGVFIASKWPILEEKQTIYNDTVLLSADTLAQKGAMYAKIQKTVDSIRRVYHVIGTHLQATSRAGANDVRRSQARQMHELMLSLDIPTSEPVIYGGDLNAALGSKLGDDIFEILDASMPEKVGELDYTSDKTINDLFAGDGRTGQSWIDYTLYSNAHLLPTNATTQVVRPRAQEPFEICIDQVKVSVGPVYPERDYCRTRKNVTDLSDHFAVLGTFNYLYYDCPAERPVLSAWIDDAVGCKADASYCDLFGLDYVCTTDIVDPSPVNLCKIGTKVLCAFPPRTTPLYDTPANELKVVSYNIWDLRYLYYECGQRQRTCRMLPEVFKMQPDVDVLVFNEAMMGGCFGGFNISNTRSIMSFREILKEQYGFQYSTRTVGTPYSLPRPENGGVFIASKWPIVDDGSKVYESSVKGTSDHFASKGVVYAKINKTSGVNSRVYHVFGTHLQAGGGDNGTIVRQNQAREMHDFMLSKNIPLEEAVIYAGDLNSGWFEDDGPPMLEILEATQPQVINMNYTTDQSINDLFFNPKKSPRWIDYAVYSSVHLQPVNATTEGFRPRSQEYFQLCMNDIAIANGPIYPWSSRCENWRNATDLSNHYAVMSKFVFDPTGKVTPTVDVPPWTTTVPTTAEATKMIYTTHGVQTTPSRYPTTQHSTTDHKVICRDDSQDIDKPTVWVDDDPDCQADAFHCARFGLDFVCQEEIIDPHPNATCQSGFKALCSYPPIPSPLVTTPATSFKALAYNVWELRYLYYQTGQRERTCRILPEVFRQQPELDVIVFNEAFMGGCLGGFNISISRDFLRFRDILDYYGFVYHTETIGNPPTLRKFENGGVFIASKWPIVESDSVIYNATVPLTSDDLSQKGAAYAKILKSVDSVSQTYHILGTHLQATSRPIANEVRLKQAKEMHELMLRKDVPPNEPVLYCGDLNADRFSELGAQIFDALDAVNPTIVGDSNYTVDKTINDIFAGDGSTSQRWIDYVLYSTEHLLPVTVTTQVVRPRSETPFQICLDEFKVGLRPIYPENDRCRKSKFVTDLADHFAVMSSFDFDGSTWQSSTPLQSSTSPTTTKSTECPRNFEELSVWVDDAPYCHADASFCDRYGLLFLCEETFTDPSPNATCPTGTRVRCAYPLPAVELVALPATTLKVVAYNVWEIRYAFLQLGQRERTCRIVPKLIAQHPDVDVIVFNEVFMGGCFAPISPLNTLTLRQILELYGFPYYTSTVGIPRPSPVKIENGGIFIASKWPILKESQIVFKEADRLSFDNFAGKGVMYAKIQKTIESQSKTFHVFGTHLQSANYNIQETIRVIQAVEMYNFQESLDIPEDEPVIYAGDLNADRINRPEHAAEVIDALRAAMPEIVGDIQYTFDELENDVHWDIETGRYWLDYVLYSVENEVPFAATLEVARPIADAPVEVCMIAGLPLSRDPVYPESPSCSIAKNISDLSDHYAVVGILDFDHSKATTTQAPEPGTTKAAGTAVIWNLSLYLIATMVTYLLLK
ncbi:hypothetical protein HOLleu_07913 [Holothuria leucospilota]|uniref:sphingomyelin phosphodiesterase n=1 Tax=Holothuria leucospilota TaxID=206669 RepID=A0A9Q1HHE3_HOLLE|nr:hypothetical protein HOLleu_07913 [Holothuria leucospilota]